MQRQYVEPHLEMAGEAAAVVFGGGGGGPDFSAEYIPDISNFQDDDEDDEEE